jgi:CheY-like chemotaxis protein
VVRVDRETVEGERVLLHFTVSDSGIGIPADQRRSIFAAFAQADSSTTRRFGGSGLGLAIAARLVERMGGGIWVESEVDRGSTFHFTVLLTPQEEAPTSMPRLPDLHDLSVLVVDDNAVNRQILGELLTSWGLRPVLVAGGGAALAELWRAAALGEPHPLVLLDHMMPDLDGVTVAEQIRQAPQIAGAIILMLSSADRPVIAERRRELGIALCLTKPIKESELLESILAALGGAGARVPAAPLPTAIERAARALRVLVAEDNPVNQRVVQEILAQRGHTLALAGNGREALAALARESFDVVLMDVQMPEMDGFQATAEIRAREASTGTRVPVLAMTAHALKGDRERCLAAGMDGYITKPIRYQELLDLVEGSGVRGDGREPRFRPAAGVQGGAGLVRELSDLFVTDAIQLSAEMRDAFARRDGEALERAAHRLRGSAGYFKADRTLDLAQRLEELGKAGDFSADTGQVLQDLVAELARLVQVLRREQGADPQPPASP